MKTIMKAIVFLSLLLAGCADTAVLRVAEYQGNLVSLGGDACVVHQSGGAHAFARVSVTYTGTNCVVEIKSDGVTDSEGN